MGRRNNLLTVCACTCLVLVLIPQDAFAFGPGAHLHWASEIMRSIPVLPLYIKALLESYPFDFFYGNIAADITIAKAYRIEYKYHCHNWNIAFEIQNTARTDAQKAFALGYLAHLAADAIAHNYFIPNRIVSSYGSRAFKHVYWEMCFDTFFRDDFLKLARELTQEVSKDNDMLLRQTLIRTLFTFNTNKRIFNNLLVLQKVRRYREAIKHLGSKKNLEICGMDFERYNSWAYRSMIDVMIKGPKSEIIILDPTGREVMASALAIRKLLKKLDLKGELDDSVLSGILDELPQRPPLPLRNSKI